MFDQETLAVIFVGLISHHPPRMERKYFIKRFSVGIIAKPLCHVAAFIR